MIVALNAAIDAVEGQLTADPSMRVDVGSLARGSGTTEYHLRRMFSSLAGMPMSDYVRRRRMSLAAADLGSGMAMARPKRSVAPSGRCMEPDPAMFEGTAGHYVPSPGSRSTSL